METLKFEVGPNRKFVYGTWAKGVEFAGFSRYDVTLEGSRLSSRDQSMKKLALEIGLDGSILIKIEKVAEASSESEIERLVALLPRGYRLFHQTESDKVIRGVRGRYYHFRHEDKGDFISFNVGAGGKPYRILLGSLTGQGSKIRTVLENIPDRPFKKANLVAILPQSIVENRQPIKAILDILEKEGYVRKVSVRGISVDYIKTDKVMPDIVVTPNLS